MKWSDNEAKILHSENHFLIAFKPSGWLTQPDGSETPSLEEYAKEWVKKEYQKPGNVYLHAIHRLDRAASGLVLFARTSKALSRLNEASRKQEIQRFYCVEVEGALKQEEGRLEHLLVHGDHKAFIDPSGKKAILFYQVQERKELSTLLRVQLETGRYHQIRAQFAAIGHPVVGDTKYGAKKVLEGGIHLQCVELRFQHPISKELQIYHSN